jgi:cytochrome P450
MTEMQPSVVYDPFSSETLADPMAAYAELREQCPLHRFENFSPPFYTVTRHDDVVAVLKDVDTWSSKYGQTPQFTKARCLNQDPPDHTEFRKLFQKGFTPRMVGRLEDEITELANALIDDMLARPSSSGDLHDLYACPLPVILIAKLLGVPPTELAQFKQWSDDLVACFNNPDPLAPDRIRAEMGAYFQEFIDTRRIALAAAGVVEPGEEHLGDVVPNDLVSGFVVATYQGRRLSDDELQTILIQLLLGGNETTTSLVTNMMLRLLEEPSRWEAVKSDPTLIDVAVEESLRFDPPVLGLFRTSLSESTLHGVTLPAKTKLMVTYASANRDPSVWSDPDEFRLDRSADELRQHLSFGLGHHFCPGAHLSRLEGRITLRLFAERLPNLRLDGATERIEPFTLWGRKRMPVAWGAPTGSDA